MGLCSSHCDSFSNEDRMLAGQLPLQRSGWVDVVDSGLLYSSEEKLFLVADSETACLQFFETGQPENEDARPKTVINTKDVSCVECGTKNTSKVIVVGMAGKKLCEFKARNGPDALVWKDLITEIVQRQFCTRQRRTTSAIANACEYNECPSWYRNLDEEDQLEIKKQIWKIRNQNRETVKTKLQRRCQINPKDCDEFLNWWFGDSKCHMGRKMPVSADATGWFTLKRRSKYLVLDKERGYVHVYADDETETPELSINLRYIDMVYHKGLYGLLLEDNEHGDFFEFDVCTVRKTNTKEWRSMATEIPSAKEYIQSRRSAIDTLLHKINTI